MGPEYTALHSLVKDEGLHTVCQEAGCPNIYECWEDREATFLIGGSQCTRRCDFCQIDTGKPADYDTDEPRRVAESVVRMHLRYATVTGVARDDLPDEGAWLHAETVRRDPRREPEHRRRDPRDRLLGQSRAAGRGVRVASGGVRAQRRDRAAHLQAHPSGLPLRALARRAHPGARVRASSRSRTSSSAWARSRTRSSQALQDLHDAGTDIITITQYLRPTPRHLPVDRWVKPQEFVEFKEEAERIGFLGVLAGPLVRSSYRAGRLWAQSMISKGRDIPPHLAHLAQDIAERGFAQAV